MVVGKAVAIALATEFGGVDSESVIAGFSHRVGA